jgi:hypothetical protein
MTQLDTTLYESGNSQVGQGIGTYVSHDSPASTSVRTKEPYDPLKSRKDRIILSLGPHVIRLAGRVAGQLGRHDLVDDFNSAGLMGAVEIVYTNADFQRSDSEIRSYALKRAKGAM